MTPGVPMLADLGIVPIVIFWVVMALVARAKKQQGQQPRQPPRPAEPRSSSSMRVSASTSPAPESGLLGDLRRAMEELKRAELQTAAPRRASKPRIQRLPMGAAPDQSSEGESLENSDYDNQAEQVVAARRQAAERRVREDVSVEELSEKQRARRASRTDIAIGGAAEHDAWHHEIGGAAESAPKPRVSPLKRFGDGSARGALVLGMILGPPPGLDQDG